MAMVYPTVARLRFCRGGKSNSWRLGDRSTQVVADEKNGRCSCGFSCWLFGTQWGREVEMRLTVSLKNEGERIEKEWGEGSGILLIFYRHRAAAWTSSDDSMEKYKICKWLLHLFGLPTTRCHLLMNALARPVVLHTSDNILPPLLKDVYAAICRRNSQISPASLSPKDELSPSNLFSSLAKTFNILCCYTLPHHQQLVLSNLPGQRVM
jgi:hypothetical protein